MKQLNILMIDNKSKSVSSLRSLLDNYGVVNLISFENLNNIDTDKFDLIVLSGSSLLNINFNYDEIVEEITLVKNSNTPIIGICFGFELICHAYGSKIERLAEHLDEFRLIKIDRSFFTNISEDIAVKESHEWGVKNVGEELVALGTSKDSIEIIKHKSKKIYGFQFHPELFSDLTQGDELFRFIVEDIFE